MIAPLIFFAQLASNGPDHGLSKKGHKGDKSLHSSYFRVHAALFDRGTDRVALSPPHTSWVHTQGYATQEHA
jgi:hypothetical protein